MIAEGKNNICGIEVIRVRISAHLSHTGEARWAEKPIDTCIADIVKALVEAGIYTDGSCCGHGSEPGSIILSDGRILDIHFLADWEAHLPGKRKRSYHFEQIV